MAMHVAVSFFYFQKLWNLFNYDKWKESTKGLSKTSVLYSFIREFSQDVSKLYKYLHVFLENEEKLIMDIENHEIYVHTSMIKDIYRICMSWQLTDEPTLQNYILLLLSYGSTIYSGDLDYFYSHSTNQENEFFDILLSMDIKEYLSHGPHLTFFYFKYTLEPNVENFVKQLVECFLYPETTEKTTIQDVRHAIKKMCELFALKNTSLRYLQDVFKEDETVLYCLDNAKLFPSLTQLSRDASRIAVCQKYNIKHISQFYNILNNLEMCEFIKRILVYDQKIYV